MRDIHFGKTVQTTDTIYHVIVVGSKNLKNNALDEIVVTINEHNDRYINYVYSCSIDKSDNNKYIVAVKEAIKSFETNEGISNFIKWDGQL